MPDDPQTPAAKPESPETNKKPRSPKQIAASLANGKKSAGPKTEAGRLKCSLAAKSQFKHEQLAETVLLTGESRPRFISLLQCYIDAFQPISEPEHNVVQKMVVAYWHHLRSWSTHQTGTNCEIARQDPTYPHNIKAAEAERILGNNTQAATRNQAAFDRLYSNAMRDLLFLRKLRATTTGLDSVPVPVASTVWELPNEDDDPPNTGSTNTEGSQAHPHETADLWANSPAAPLLEAALQPNGSQTVRVKGEAHKGPLPAPAATTKSTHRSPFLAPPVARHKHRDKPGSSRQVIVRRSVARTTPRAHGTDPDVHRSGFRRSTHAPYPNAVLPARTTQARKLSHGRPAGKTQHQYLRIQSQRSPPPRQTAPRRLIPPCDLQYATHNPCPISNSL